MELATEASSDASTMIAERVSRLRADVDGVARSTGRDPAAITIVAVSKFHSPAQLLAAYAAGLRAFAENYVQEALPKFAVLPPDAERHFVGHIQTNKAKQIVSGFDVVQSVDRVDAGLALAKAARAQAKRLRVLVQLNISPSERFGVAPAAAPALAELLRAEGLDVAGVMAIGPITEDLTAIRNAFARAAEAQAAVGGPILSLGMSGDWREALTAGSTMIRIGTAIFGPRISSKGVLQ